MVKYRNFLIVLVASFLVSAIFASLASVGSSAFAKTDGDESSCDMANELMVKVVVKTPIQANIFGAYLSCTIEAKTYDVDLISTSKGYWVGTLLKVAQEGVFDVYLGVMSKGQHYWHRVQPSNTFFGSMVVFDISEAPVEDQEKWRAGTYFEIRTEQVTLLAPITKNLKEKIHSATLSDFWFPGSGPRVTSAIAVLNKAVIFCLRCPIGESEFNGALSVSDRLGTKTDLGSVDLTVVSRRWSYVNE